MSDFQALKDRSQEKQLTGARLLLASFVVLVMLSALVARFYYLQISQFEFYDTHSNSNRVHLRHVTPTRGLIYDRNGVLIAENQPSFLLSLVKERVPDLEATFEVLKSLQVIDDEDIERFYKRSNRYRVLEDIPLRFNLSDEQISRLAANRIRLPGVKVKANLARYYPYNDLFAHMLGYVGRINEKDLDLIDRDNYRATSHIGKIGIERSYEAVLHGQIGIEQVETNAAGVVLRTLNRDDPIPGQDLRLHIDLELQKIAYKALQGRRGAVVALDPRNGGVLAAVSAPSYDSNLFVNGISYKDYNQLREDIDLPLFNRVIQGEYPPGSTIKPIVGLAGLEEKIVTEKTTIEDPGWYQLPNDERLYRDWKREGHADKVDFEMAMEESCDVYYYDLAYKLGVRKLHEYFDAFGLGRETGIDVPNERDGLNPTPEWKVRQGRPGWFPGDSLNIGIGQGFLLTTPLQLAFATSIVANQGERLIPTMVAAVGDKPLPARRMPHLKLNNEKNWDIVLHSLEEVIHGKKGTAQRIRYGLDYKIAGKTGTAQVIGIAQGEEYDAELVAERQRDHALFVGFAPSENPSIVIAVVVENGEHGSSTAAPIFRQMIDSWVKREEKQLALGDN